MLICETAIDSSVQIIGKSLNTENANNLALLDFGSNETLTTINVSALQFMGILNLNPFNSSGFEGQQWILPRIDTNFSSTTYSKFSPA